MIETPQIVQTTAQKTAVIHLTVPRSEIQKVMGPALNEVSAALVSQGIPPAGPVFSYHFKMQPGTFDFQTGFPVATDVTPTGRVETGELRATKVARTTYRGGYEGLAGAWGEFHAWIDAQGLKPAPDLWEFYVTGPAGNSDPATWQTELNRPLLD